MNRKEKFRYLLVVSFIAIVVLGAWLRFSRLEIKPLHHDEGVNSYFLKNLADAGAYRYDPSNYHGPTLYYFSLISLRIFGENDFALRAWPALTGLLALLLIWPVRDRLGKLGTVTASLAMGLSPGLVYFSRDFIHEITFGCFSLGIVVGAVKYHETKKFSWLLLSSASAGLLFATKETAIITAGVMIIAFVSASLVVAARNLYSEGRLNPAELSRETVRGLRPYLPTLDHAVAAIIIFIFINLIFYSSLFQNRQGLIDSVKSIAMWSKRSGSEHVKSFWYYAVILFKLELPLLAGSLIAGILIVWRGCRFWLFTGAWAFGLFLAYSIIGYKTPWLVVSFLIPMALLTGYAAQQVNRLVTFLSARLLWTLVLIIIMVLSWDITRKINFDKYDDNGNSTGYFSKWGEKWKLRPYIEGQYGYVYAQTDRDLLNLVKAVRTESEKFPAPLNTGIYIATSDYWPLPWYLRDYDQVAYTAGFNAAGGEPPSVSQPIIIANENQRHILEKMKGFSVRGPSFTLRPGVELLLLVRE